MKILKSIRDIIEEIENHATKTKLLGGVAIEQWFGVSYFAWSFNYPFDKQRILDVKEYSSWRKLTRREALLHLISSGKMIELAKKRLLKKTNGLDNILTIYYCFEAKINKVPVIIIYTGDFHPYAKIVNWVKIRKPFHEIWFDQIRIDDLEGLTNIEWQILKHEDGDTLAVLMRY